MIFRTWKYYFWILTWWLFKFISRKPINNVWCDNIQGERHEFLEIDHLHHLCWVLKYLWDGIVRVCFGCWLGNFRDFIFFNIITADRMFPIDRFTIMVRLCKYHKGIRNQIIHVKNWAFGDSTFYGEEFWLWCIIFLINAMRLSSLE